MKNIVRKAFVFDFDDTLAFTDAKVHVRNEVGRLVTSLTPKEFNDCVASAIAEFLALHNVTAKEILCGGGWSLDIAKAKRKVLLSIIENFDKVWFFDDDARNIELAKELNCKAKKV